VFLGRTDLLLRGLRHLFLIIGDVRLFLDDRRALDADARGGRTRLAAQVGPAAPAGAGGCTGERLVPADRGTDVEPGLELAQVHALLVEDVERDLGPRLDHHVVSGALEQRLFDRAQDVQRDRGRGADEARAAAVVADHRGAFQDARADALARHLEQAEGRDAADLDARPVVLQALLQLLLDGAVVALLLHVDEVDDDEAGKVAQTQLARDLLGRLEIRLER